jgi:hypothetical protein
VRATKKRQGTARLMADWKAARWDNCVEHEHSSAPVEQKNVLSSQPRDCPVFELGVAQGESSVKAAVVV